MKIDGNGIKIEMRLNRVSSNGDRDGMFRLTVADADSRCTMLEADFGPDALADLLSSRLAECGAMVWLDRVGKVREFKTVHVPILTGFDWDKRSEEARAAVAPFEVDGWRGCDTDYLNSKRRGPTSANVTFERWVEKEQKEATRG